jgi:hypothetical protein
MPEALSSIGNFFSQNGGTVAKLGEVGLAGAGLGGNLAAEHQKAQLLKQLQNPQALANQAAGMAQPLNAGLVQAVNNQVGGNMAEQGLSQSPGIIAATTGQALAPYEQQNQQMALSQLMQSLQLRLAGNPSPVNLAPLLALLGQKQPQSPGNVTVGGGSGGMSPEQMLNNVWGNSGDSSFSGMSPTDISDFSNVGTGQ